MELAGKRCLTVQTSEQVTQTSSSKPGLDLKMLIDFFRAVIRDYLPF